LGRGIGVGFSLEVEAKNKAKALDSSASCPKIEMYPAIGYYKEYVLISFISLSRLK